MASRTSGEREKTARRRGDGRFEAARAAGGGAPARGAVPGIRARSQESARPGTGARQAEARAGSVEAPRRAVVERPSAERSVVRQRAKEGVVAGGQAREERLCVVGRQAFVEDVFLSDREGRARGRPDEPRLLRARRRPVRHGLLGRRRATTPPQGAGLSAEDRAGETTTSTATRLATAGPFVLDGGDRAGDRVEAERGRDQGHHRAGRAREETRAGSVRVTSREGRPEGCVGQYGERQGVPRRETTGRRRQTRTERVGGGGDGAPAQVRARDHRVSGRAQQTARRRVRQRQDSTKHRRKGPPKRKRLRPPRQEQTPDRLRLGHREARQSRRNQQNPTQTPRQGSQAPPLPTRRHPTRRRRAPRLSSSEQQQQSPRRQPLLG
mmetsp:Transcript_5022/g.15761  ORF Transcript_5022/g.15761 Transcript_5022/m.15761 type:complete len:382 (-) Transcript_5022:246-1391(-)